MTDVKRFAAQARRIEDALAAHNVKSRSWGGDVTASYIRHQLMVPTTQRLSGVARLAEEVAYNLGVDAVRIYREHGVVIVEVPTEKRQIVSLAKVELAVSKAASKPAPVFGVIGVDQNGKPLLLRINSHNVVHVLIAGTTGSGKTVLMRTMVDSIAAHNSPDAVRLLLLDPKGGRGLEALSNLPHVAANATGPEHAVSALRWAVSQMEQRDAERRSIPLVLVVVDELADLVMQEPEAVTLLTRLTQRGREAGMHVIAGTQRPDSSILSGLLKSNFPVRLVGKVTTPEDSKVATGRAQADAHKLLGRGDFLAVSDRIVRFQVAVRDAELQPARPQES